MTWNKWHFQTGEFNRSRKWSTHVMIVFVKEKLTGVIRRIKWFVNGEARTSDQRLVSEDGSGLGKPRHSIRMVGARTKVGAAPLAKEVYNVVLKALPENSELLVWTCFLMRTTSKGITLLKRKPTRSPTITVGING